MGADVCFENRPRVLTWRVKPENRSPAARTPWRAAPTTARCHATGAGATDAAVGPTAPLRVREFVLELGGRGDDGGDVVHRHVPAAVALREQAAELVDGVDRIQPHRAGVGAHPGAGVEAARPGATGRWPRAPRTSLFDPGLGGDLVERSMAALTVAAQAGDERFLRGHRVGVSRQQAAPRTRALAPPRWRSAPRPHFVRATTREQFPGPAPAPAACRFPCLVRARAQPWRAAVARDRLQNWRLRSRS